MKTDKPVILPVYKGVCTGNATFVMKGAPFLKRLESDEDKSGDKSAAIGEVVDARDVTMGYCVLYLF